MDIVKLCEKRNVIIRWTFRWTFFGIFELIQVQILPKIGRKSGIFGGLAPPYDHRDSTKKRAEAAVRCRFCPLLACKNVCVAVIRGLLRPEPGLQRRSRLRAARMVYSAGFR